VVKNLDKYFKKQVKKKGFSYIRKGKTVNVPSHKQSYWRSKRDTSKMLRRLRRRGAENMFAEYPVSFQIVDKKENADLMFAIPNIFWIENVAKYDVFGLDGFLPPSVDKKPRFGLPYQMVMYEGYIWEADPNGMFVRSKMKIEWLKPEDKKNQDKYLEETGKNAIGEDEGYTIAYSDWLNDKLEFSIDVGNIMYKETDKTANLLDKIGFMKELRDSGLPRDRIEAILISAYNKTKPNDPQKSFTNAVENWEKNYAKTIRRIVRTIENKNEERIKEANRQEAMQEAYDYSPSGEALGIRVINEINHLRAIGLLPQPPEMSKKEKFKSTYDWKTGKGSYVGKTFDYQKFQEDEQFEKIKDMIESHYTSKEIEDLLIEEQWYEAGIPEEYMHLAQSYWREKHEDDWILYTPRDELTRAELVYKSHQNWNFILNQFETYLASQKEDYLGYQKEILTPQQYELVEEVIGEEPNDHKTALKFDKFLEEEWPDYEVDFELITKGLSPFTKEEQFVFDKEVALDIEELFRAEGVKIPKNLDKYLRIWIEA